MPADPASPEAATGRNAEQELAWPEAQQPDTRAASPIPDARLARKSDGQSSILAYAGHVLMENRNGLVAQSCLTHATGTAERDAALVLVDRLGPRPITLGADKGYDVMGFVQALRQRRVTPHIATRHPGYAASQRVRKRIEEVFGWMKSLAGFRQTRHRGRERVAWCFDLAATAYNLIRMPKLLAPTA